MPLEYISNQAPYTTPTGKINSTSSIKATYGTPKFAIIDEEEGYLITAQKDYVYFYNIHDGVLQAMQGGGGLPMNSKVSSDIEALAKYDQNLFAISQQYLMTMDANNQTENYCLDPSKKGNKLAEEICIYIDTDGSLCPFVMDIKGNLYKTFNGGVPTGNSIQLNTSSSRQDYDTHFPPQLTLLDGYLFYLEYNTDQVYLRCIDPESMKEVTSSKLLLPKVSKYGYTITVIAPTGMKPYLLLTTPTNMVTVNPKGKTYPGGALRAVVVEQFQTIFKRAPYRSAYELMDLSYHPSPPIYNTDTDRVYLIGCYHFTICMTMLSTADGNCTPRYQFGNLSNWVMDELEHFFMEYPSHMASSWYGSFINKLLDHAPFPGGEQGFCQLLKENILKNRLGPWDNVLKMKLQEDVLNSGLDFEGYYKKHIEPSLPLGTSPHSIKPFPESMAFGYVLLYLCYLIKNNFDQTYSQSNPTKGMAKVVKAFTDSNYLSLIGSELTLDQVLLFGQFLGPMPQGTDASAQKEYKTRNLKDSLSLQAYLGLVCGELTKEGFTTPIPLPHFIFAANKDKIYRVSTVESGKLGIVFSQLDFNTYGYQYIAKGDPTQPDIKTGVYSSMHLYDNRLYIIGEQYISLYNLPTK